MAKGIEYRTDEGDYKTRAHDFMLADDLYLFFKFESPKSECEIGIAYDEFIDGGDWYVNDGELGGCDYQIIDDIVRNWLPNIEEWEEVELAVDATIRKFNG